MSIDWSLKDTAAARAALDLTVTREVALAEVLAWIGDFAAGITGTITETEAPSWEYKEKAARAVVDEAATAEQTAVLAAEAAETGETVAELAGFIIDRADRFRLVQARLTGFRRRAQSQFDAASSALEIGAAKASILSDAETFAAAVRAAR